MILIHDKQCNIPLCCGPYDTTDEAILQMERIKRKKRENDKKCEDFARWVEFGKTLAYYVDKEVLSETIVENEVKYTLDVEKARANYENPYIRTIEDLDSCIKMEILETNKSILTTFTSDKDYDFFNDNE